MDSSKLYMHRNLHRSSMSIYRRAIYTQRSRNSVGTGHLLGVAMSLSKASNSQSTSATDGVLMMLAAYGHDLVHFGDASLLAVQSATLSLSGDNHSCKHTTASRACCMDESQWQSQSLV